MARFLGMSEVVPLGLEVTWVLRARPSFPPKPTGEETDPTGRTSNSLSVDLQMSPDLNRHSIVRLRHLRSIWPPNDLISHYTLRSGNTGALPGPDNLYETAPVNAGPGHG